MRIKNIFKKAVNLLAVMAFFNLLLAAPIYGSTIALSDEDSGKENNGAIASCWEASNNNISTIAASDKNFQINESCVKYAGECGGIKFFLSVMLVVFLALIFWTVSPVGILFFLSAEVLLAKSSSGFKKKIARVARIIAFLSWASVMFLLFIVYVDSVSYRVLNLGGDILNLAIISGFAFFVVMILVVFIEKTACCKNSAENNKKNNKENGDNIKENKSGPRRSKKSEESVKFAGIEFGGVKGKVKNKLKEDLKKIIDDKIDKLQ